MVRFRFRLQRVLRVQELREEEACAAWRIAEASAAEAEEHARSRAAERDAAVAEIAAGRARIVPAESLWRHAQVDRMTALAARQRERARTLRYQAELARAPFEEHRRERRALDRLRERSETRHREAERRREAAKIDEIVLARLGRGRNE